MILQNLAADCKGGVGAFASSLRRPHKVMAGKSTGSQVCTAQGLGSITAGCLELYAAYISEPSERSTRFLFRFGGSQRNSLPRSEVQQTFHVTFFLSFQGLLLSPPVSISF